MMEIWIIIAHEQVIKASLFLWLLMRKWSKWDFFYHRLWASDHSNMHNIVIDYDFNLSLN